MKVFFQPWKGGANIDCNGLNGKKILVIGASRYCPLRLNSMGVTDSECNKPQPAICIEAGTDYNKWRKIMKKCPLMGIPRSDKRDHSDKYRLDRINTWSVCPTGIYKDDQERAYVIFSKILDIALNTETSTLRNGMSRVNFCNFLQTILTETKFSPSYNDNPRLYRESFVIIDEIITDMKPDGIILWSSKNIWEGFVKVYKESKGEDLKSTNYPARYQYHYGENEIPFVSIPHPVKFYDFNGPWTEDEFNKYENSITGAKPTIIDNIRFLYNLEQSL